MSAPNCSLRIDAHQHVFWHGRDDHGLIADMDANAIREVWLLTWEMAADEHRPEGAARLNPTHLRSDGTHLGIPLDGLLRARDRFPDRFTVGFCPHPIGDAAARFAAAHAMHGVRVCGEFKFKVLLDDPRCLELFWTAGEAGCPVVLHLDVPYLRAGPNEQDGWVYQSRWAGGTVDNLERALEACPATIFIGHAPGFRRHISGDADRDPKLYPDGPVIRPNRLETLLDAHPNLYADLSAASTLRAMARDPAYTADLLTRHARRFLFGRDDYGDALIRFLDQLHLPEAVRQRIDHQNATDLLCQNTSGATKCRTASD